MGTTMFIDRLLIAVNSFFASIFVLFAMGAFARIVKEPNGLAILLILSLLALALSQLKRKAK